MSQNTTLPDYSSSYSTKSAQSGYYLVDPGSNHQFRTSVLPRQQSIFNLPAKSRATHRTLLTSLPTNSGMQSHPSEDKIRVDDLSEDSGQLTASSNTSRKRSRDTPTYERADLKGRLQPSSKLGHSDSYSRKRRVSGSSQSVLSFQDRPTEDAQDEDYNSWSAYPKGSECLAAKQRKFVRQWFDTFARSDPQLALSNESICALATLIQARPQIIYEYLSKTHPSLNNKTTQSPTNSQMETTSPQQQEGQQDTPEPYTLTTANAHLPPSILSLVTRYITTCRRPRLRADGRRSVNTGPYRCTFACGYRTKRAFDWRRHEETHEPQELWLCTFCSQQQDGGKKEPFLVSRKDKFLKHAKECHKEWMPEKVLELSRVDYRPRGEVKCPICGWRGEGVAAWDERCRHVLGHFEDEVEQGLRRPSILSVGGKASVEGSVAEGSLQSGGSEDEECDSPDGDDEKATDQ
ncbi:Nn.00g063810.m01.CDS01 [Neocucurbitaria sp. VM-36]